MAVEILNPFYPKRALHLIELSAPEELPLFKNAGTKEVSFFHINNALLLIMARIPGIKNAETKGLDATSPTGKLYKKSLVSVLVGVMRIFKALNISGEELAEIRPFENNQSFCEELLDVTATISECCHGLNKGQALPVLTPQAEGFIRHSMSTFWARIQGNFSNSDQRLSLQNALVEVIYLYDEG